MLNSRTKIASVGLIIATILLASCGGGSDTVANPNIGTNTSNEYKGPPAATEDVLSFQKNFWEQLRKENACLQCHDQGQDPEFLNFDDINFAYSQAISYANFVDPTKSQFSTKVGAGHNCWLGSNSDCSLSIERMITNWANDSGSSTTRVISLTPRHPVRDPGDAKSFPTLATDNAPNSFAQTVHPVLTTIGQCQGCHDDSVALPISPFFANASATTAYEAAKPKMDIDTPANS